jgi:hypothetical protein
MARWRLASNRAESNGAEMPSKWSANPYPLLQCECVHLTSERYYGQMVAKEPTPSPSVVSRLKYEVID